MKYTPTAPPAVSDDMRSITDWLMRELENIGRAFQEQDHVQLVVRSTSIERARSGMLTYADSVNWNPGSGAGFYGYVATSWVKL